MNQFFERFIEDFYQYMEAIDPKDQLALTKDLIAYVNQLTSYYADSQEDESVREAADQFLSEHIYETYAQQVQAMRQGGFFSYFQAESHPLALEKQPTTFVRFSASPVRYDRKVFRDILGGLKGFLITYRDQLTLHPSETGGASGKNLQKNIQKMLVKVAQREQKDKPLRLSPQDIAVILHGLQKHLFEQQDLDNYELGVIAKLLTGVSNNTVQNALPKQYHTEQNWLAENYYSKRKIEKLETLRDAFQTISTELDEAVKGYYQQKR